YVESSDARTGATRIQSLGAYGIQHEGIEETNRGGFRFVITIKHPKDAKQRAEYLKQLAKAAADTKARKTVLTIPVEDKQSGYKPPVNPTKGQFQVTVDWRGPTGGRAKSTTSRYKSEPIDIRF